MNEPAGWSSLAAVFYAAAVGFGLGDFEFLAGLELLNGFAHVVSGRARVAFGRRTIVDGPLVGKHAILINDEHVRRGAHAIFFSNLTRAIIQPGGGFDFLLG